MQMNLRKLTPFLCALPLLLGCKTLSDPALIQFVADRAGQAAHVAVLVDLKTYPTHAPAYAAAVQALDGLMQSPNYSSAELKAILAKLPIKEFRGDTGALILEGGLMVFDLVTMFGYHIQSQPAILAVMLSVRNGINDALPPTADSVITATPRSPLGRPTPDQPLTPKRVRSI